MKIRTSHTYFVSLESLSQMFSSLETNLKAELALILKLVNLILTDAPSVKPVEQGEEKGVGSWKDSTQ